MRDRGQRLRGLRPRDELESERPRRPAQLRPGVARRGPGRGYSLARTRPETGSTVRGGLRSPRLFDQRLRRAAPQRETHRAGLASGVQQHNAQLGRVVDQFLFGVGEKETDAWTEKRGPRANL